MSASKASVTASVSASASAADFEGSVDTEKTPPAEKKMAENFWPNQQVPVEARNLGAASNESSSIAMM